MSRRRTRKLHPLANATVIRTILAEVRAHFPALPLQRDTTVVKFLRAALHAASHEPTYSGLGRPPKWGRETSLEAARFVQSSLDRRTNGNLSFTSFVKHYCPMLDFPADVLASLESGQVTVFEAELLACVVPGAIVSVATVSGASVSGRLEIADEKEARQKRSEILMAHLRSQGTSDSLRLRVRPEILGATKVTLKSFAPQSLVTNAYTVADRQQELDRFAEQVEQDGSVADLQREIDQYAERVDQVDYTFLFVDSLTFLVQNMLKVDLSKLSDTHVDGLLAKLDETVEAIRVAVAKSKR